ncbi:SGNH/GDSL hydrolase family protein [Mycobacterium sp. C31M]
MTFTYVALGDSQSEGVGDLPWPGGRPRGWTDRLAATLADNYDSVQYANLAVRGKRAPDVLAEQVGPAGALKPDLVTATAGVNDVLRPSGDVNAVVDALDQLLAELALVAATTILVKAPNLACLSIPGQLLAGRVAALNAGIDQIAGNRGVLVLTAPDGSVFEDLRAWSPDRLHLNALGHERLARGAARLLGLPEDPDWFAPIDGPTPRRTPLTETRWAVEHFAPWIGRRLRGISSADGRTAKQPELQPVSPLPLNHQR